MRITLVDGDLRGFYWLSRTQRLDASRHSPQPFLFPAGTGKTVVGTHIVYWFHKLNQETPEETSLKDAEKMKKCILYCGPSNKSVDVVAGN